MNRLSALLLSLPLAVAACSTVKVETEHDPFTDFSGLTSYAWKSSPQVPEDSAPDFAGELRAAVDEELKANGLQELKPTTADLLVRCRVAVKDKVEYKDPYYAYKAVETYEEGTLVLDLISRRADKLVWRGTGSARHENDLSPDARQARIRAVVDSILAEYPPAAAD